MTMSNMNEPGKPIRGEGTLSVLFKSLPVIKFFDRVTFLIAIFLYKFHNHLLPTTFYSFFTRVKSVHNYNTRFSRKQSVTIFFMLELTMVNSISSFKARLFGTLLKII